MNKQELINKRNMIDSDTTKWMGRRKKINMIIVNNAIFAMEMLDSIIRDFDKGLTSSITKIHLPDRIPKICN